MALFGIPSQVHLPFHSFLHCWANFAVDAWVVHATTWQTDEKNPSLYNACLWATKGLNAEMVDLKHLAYQNTAMKTFMMGHQWGMFFNVLGTMGSQEVPIQQGEVKIRSLNWPVTCHARNVDKMRGINTG